MTKNNYRKYLYAGVMAITDEGKRVRILIDINVPLILLMEKKKYSISGLYIGDPVIVECPKESIEISQAEENRWNGR